jgi:two-component system sensor histidine kinase KdpD
VLRNDDGSWLVEAAAGSPVPSQPGEATVVEPLAANVVLALVGDQIAAEDRYVLNAFSAQLAAVLDRGRLRAEAGRAHGLAEASELRSSLLQAVSHDLRTPLASIKAAASSLQEKDVEWPPDASAEFLATIVEETDRLITLVANLLDMSRLQVGALQSALRPIGLDEVVLAALASLGPRAAGVDLDVPAEGTRLDPDAVARRRPADGVLDHVGHRPFEQRRVGLDGGKRLGHVEVDPGRPRSEAGHGGEDDLLEADRPHDELEGTGLESAHVQQVADERVEAIGLLIDRREELAPGLR